MPTPNLGADAAAGASAGKGMPAGKGMGAKSQTVTIHSSETPQYQLNPVST